MSLWRRGERWKWWTWDWFYHTITFGFILCGLALRVAALRLDTTSLVIVYSGQVVGSIGYVYMWFLSYASVIFVVILCYCTCPMLSRWTAAMVLWSLVEKRDSGWEAALPDVYWVKRNRGQSWLVLPSLKEKNIVCDWVRVRIIFTIYQFYCCYLNLIYLYSYMYSTVFLGP